MKTLKEIMARKAEIRSLLQSDNEVDVDALEKELRELDEAQQGIEKRQQIANAISTGAIVPNEFNKPQGKEERNYGLDSNEYTCGR